MPRYGPPPDAEPPPPPPEDDKSGLTRWSWRSKVLAVVATFGMIVAFVFEFLPPTNSGGSQKISTTIATTTTLATSTTPQLSTTVLPSTTTAPTSVPPTTTTS